MAPRRPKSIISQLLDNIPWSEVLKFPVVVAFATAPISAAAMLLPFVNPKIIQDVWWPTVVAMVVVSGVTSITTLSNSGMSRRAPGYISAIVFLLSLSALYVITSDVVVIQPALAALLARLLVLGFFVGVAGFAAFFLTWWWQRPT